MNVEEIENLVLIEQNSNMQISGILFSGILIASLGAVMDVSMSVASTINEIYDRNPGITSRELFKSGINVGRDMMGTMSNTLIIKTFCAMTIVYGKDVCKAFEICLRIVKKAPAHAWENSTA